MSVSIKGLRYDSIDVGTGGKYLSSVIIGVKTCVTMIVVAALFVIMIPVVMTLGLAGLIKEKPKA
jgi:hypothetical protein